jgi:gluconokinase
VIIRPPVLLGPAGLQRGAKMGGGNDTPKTLNGQPWLQRLHAILQEAVAKDENLILACSALKRSYRRRLGIDQQAIHSVFLKGTAELLERRIAARTHDYMNASLLQSQLKTLEVPETGIIVNLGASPDTIVDKIISALPIN